MNRHDATTPRTTNVASWRGGGFLFLLMFFVVGSASAQDVKTIKPGMTEAEVREQWGEPLTVKKLGIMSYMYYRSECLRTCGTNDVVFLENGQVIDAVVRDRSRKYDGIASSPADRKPEPTAPSPGA